MPKIEYDKIIGATLVPEISKVKIGDRGGTNGAPNKIEPVITSALKPKGGKKFAEDDQAMAAIKRHIKEGGPGRAKLAIPVRLFADKIEDNFFIYRAIYNAMNSAMCLSAGGDDKAHRRFAEARYAKGLKILDTLKEVTCDTTCSNWTKPGEKGDCAWHANLTLQIDLDGYHRFPSRTVFRTSGWQVLQYMIGSLRAISQVTNGVLANIPLWFVHHEIEGFNKAEGKRRRYPVMSFEFWGTMDELRGRAAYELHSRHQLLQAQDPRQVPGDEQIRTMVSAPMKMLPSMGMDDGEDEGGAMLGGDDATDLDDVMALMGGGGGSETTVAVGDGAAQAPSPAAAAPESALEGEGLEQPAPEVTECLVLKQRLRMSDAAYDLVVDKHEGDMALVLTTLQAMAAPKPAPAPTPTPTPAAVKPAPVPAPKATTTTAEIVAAAVAKTKATAAAKAPVVTDDGDDMLALMAMGEASDEPAETEDTAPTMDSVVAGVSQAPVSRTPVPAAARVPTEVAAADKPAAASDMSETEEEDPWLVYEPRESMAVDMGARPAVPAKK